MIDWNELCIKSATMDEEKFKLEYHHDWVISERVNLIVELAHEYHQRCDAFDRNICTGKNRYGEPMPVTSWQFKAVNRNALLVLRELKERIENNQYGVTKDELIKAIQNYKF